MSDNGATDISERDISDYKKLYRAKFGKDLDNQVAREQLSKLVRMMEIVYQPITKKQMKELAEEDSSQVQKAKLKRM
ncbi:hypothetical protein A3F38_01190 [Candidatus Saccharibacteria bacterium RIFCSPHIGHO2_12_FULL_48_21]|nr:MAG: hypothetical protein A3F38_01190 [Candidatus Saccharibacteria bacterium RIFCSPHIGHO2_12_FULL_48_21]